jgi:hypothetical protein
VCVCVVCVFENVFVCVGYLAIITCMHGQEGTPSRKF